MSLSLLSQRPIVRIVKQRNAEPFSNTEVKEKRLRGALVKWRQKRKTKWEEEHEEEQTKEVRESIRVNSTIPR